MPTLTDKRLPLGAAYRDCRADNGFITLKLQSEFNMKKSKKVKNPGLKEQDIEVGYLYFTTANQYRAVLAMKADFLIYAPSSEGLEPMNPNCTEMPFENSPFKKCQIVTFAKKEYQAFDFNGAEAVKHKLNDTQLNQAIAQCNAEPAIAALLAE